MEAGAAAAPALEATPPLVHVRVEGVAALALPSVGLLSPLRSLPLTQVRSSRRMRLELAVALIRPALTDSRSVCNGGSRPLVLAFECRHNQPT